MVENTAIEWATHTFSPWIGCTKVGPGCDHCYAEVWDGKSEGESRWGPHAARKRTRQGNWDRVVTWNSKARDAGRRDSVFVASLSDVFDTHASIRPEWRRDLAALVRKCPHLDFMFLTKRAGNVEKILRQMFPGGAPKNLWIGATIVNQAEADRDIVKLLRAKAACGFPVAFLSMEPLLGPVSLVNLPFPAEGTEKLRYNALTGVVGLEGPMGPAANPRDPFVLPALDWIIVGGETGMEARPMHADWARGLRAQCVAHATPFLFKQWGNWFPCGEIDAEGRKRTAFDPMGTEGAKGGGAPATQGDHLYDWSRVGASGTSVYMDKKLAGRALDGRTWDGVPRPQEG